MQLVTLEELRRRAREEADMVNSGFVTVAELDTYINSAAQELYDLLTTKFEDYYIADPFSFTIANGANSFPVPDDFYKIRGVDVDRGGDRWGTAKPFTFEERNRLSDPLLYPAYDQSYVYYRLRGDTIFFVGPQSGFSGRLWYIPVMPKLEAESDTFDGINGWEEYIIIEAAIRMKGKEESDVQLLAARKDAITKRINDTAANRDAGTPERVTDVSSDADWFPYRR